MTNNPNIIRKSIGDNIPLTFDWTKTLIDIGAQNETITISNWSVISGTVNIGADSRPSTVVGKITTCYISGGTVDETSIINNSITLSNGNDVVKLFQVCVHRGDYVDE